LFFANVDGGPEGAGGLGEKAILAQAENDYTRRKNLGNNVVSQQEVERAGTHVAAARARVAEATARQEEAVLKFKLLEQQVQAKTPLATTSAPSGREAATTPGAAGRANGNAGEGLAIIPAD
jgi:multidrug resistance efflux pump